MSLYVPALLSFEVWVTLFDNFKMDGNVILPRKNKKNVIVLSKYKSLPKKSFLEAPYDTFF